MARTGHRSLWMLGVALLYIIAQSVWWAVLLLRREQEIAMLRGGTGDSRTLMVLGEAGVFVLLLCIISTMAFFAIRRDLRLAAMQRNFLLAITHELRTPIAAVKLQLQTLERPGLSEAVGAELRASAIREADRLADLTDKVLLAASEGAREIPLKKQRIEAVGAIRDAVHRAQQHDLGAHPFVIDLPDSLPVVADPQALRSIIENLLENGVKYSPSGGTITVRAVENGSRWTLEVCDQGAGIPEDERAKVFERFYRSGAEETRQHRGTGLGLYIVKRLVQRHGGTITIRDAHPHGAIFVASFPNH